MATYTIEYYNPRIKAEIESWSDGLLADFARMIELLMEFGPNMRMPHSRAMGKGLFELKPRGKEGIGRVFYCQSTGRNNSRVCKENTRNARTRIKNCAKTAQGGPRCLILNIIQYLMTINPFWKKR